MKVNKNSLYIVSTPIGNLDDITLRAIDVLKNSDIILCEDTRHSLKLLNHFKIRKKLIPYHKFNEKKQLTRIIEHINEGKILSLISDAGTPLLSDPGRLILKECLKKKINVVPIPGVSSITTAMSVSGFDDKFLFFGFLPKKNNELDSILNYLSKIHYTLVFFIPAIKINFYIKKFREHFPKRELMVAREMTKVHEEFIRVENKDTDVSKNLNRGELTVIVSNATKLKKELDKEKIINKAKKYLKKYSLKDTVDLIIESEGYNKKEIYQLCLKIKNEKNI